VSRARSRPAWAALGPHAHPRRHLPWPLRGRPPGRQPRRRPPTVVAHPAETPATRRVPPPRAAACTRAHRAAAATGAPHAGLACLVAQRASAAAAARTQPGGPGPPPTSHRPTRLGQRRPRPGLLGRRSSRRRPGSHRGLHRFRWSGSPGHLFEVGGCGRVRTDGADTRRLDTGWGGSGRLDAGRVDSRRPTAGLSGRRPPVTGHRTAGQPDPGRPKPDGWTPHAGHRRPTPWRGCWQGRPRRRRLSSRYRLNAPPGIRRLGEQQPGPLHSKDSEGTHAATDGSGHRRDRQRQVVLRRRPAGALAHCCPRTITGRA
jgi:hypothetical protein